MSIEINNCSDVKGLCGISIGSLNVRSLFKNFDECKVIIKECDLDIVLLQETFLNEYVGDHWIEIDGYELTRLDRVRGVFKKGGGGIGAYTKKKHNINQIHDCSDFTPHIETSWMV